MGVNFCCGKNNVENMPIICNTRCTVESYWYYSSGGKLLVLQLHTTTPHLHTLMAHVQSYSSSLFASHEAAESVEERREEDVDSSELPRERPRQATVPV